MKKFSLVSYFLLFGIIFSGCNDVKDTGSQKKTKLRLATSTSTTNSGLLDILLPKFTALYGIEVEVFSKGTGAALAKAKAGEADVVLVHSRSAEDEFVNDGYGLNRQDVMYNDYVFLGSESLLSDLGAGSDLLGFLQKVKEKRVKFYSRGDDSGTHKRELKLWKLADGKPAENYISVGGGMLDTLMEASHSGGLVMSDRGTYLFNRDKLKLKVLYEGDERLRNNYGIIAVAPTKVSGVNFSGAMKFIEFIKSERTMKIIDQYGKEKFGVSLFKSISETGQK